jgi:hypothetical protein
MRTMRMKMKTMAVALVATLSGVPAARAADVSFGVGYDNAFGDGSGAAAFTLQLASDPVWTLGPAGFGLGTALETNTNGDLWGGGGLTLGWPFAAVWSVDASLMAGGYIVRGDDAGSGVDFRTRLGVSRAVGPAWRLGVAVEDKANTGGGSGSGSVLLVFSRPLAGWGAR